MSELREQKVIPIRPHHGMCLAFYEGKGYSGEFTAHMGEMLKIFLTDVPVKLTVWTDEICRKCPNKQGMICGTGENAERFDRDVLRICGFSEGEELPFLRFAQVVQEKILEKGLRESICGECGWNEICVRKKSLWENME